MWFKSPTGVYFEWFEWWMLTVPDASSADFCMALASWASSLVSMLSEFPSELIRALAGSWFSGRNLVFVPVVPISSSLCCRSITHCNNKSTSVQIYGSTTSSFMRNTICLQYYIKLKRECPYVTKYARIVVHRWNWHIVRKQMSTVNLNNLYARGD